MEVGQGASVTSTNVKVEQDFTKEHPAEFYDGAGKEAAEAQVAELEGKGMGEKEIGP